jgi:uncharacterized protein (TIGR01244 family)
MNKQLENEISVSGQINEETLRQLAAQGIKTIVNNRPDAEEAGQPSNATLQAVAEQLDVKWILITIAKQLMKCQNRFMCFAEPGVGLK